LVWGDRQIRPASGRLQLALGAILAFAFATGLAADEPVARVSRDDVSPKSFAALHKLIGPQPGDYRWEEVAWVTSLWHARERAAAEDKPIFCFGTGGAGFNDPLGNC
jgi:hypothetical protein